MKYLLTACLLWVAAITLAQEIPLDEKTGKAHYEGVNQVPGVTAAVLYDRAQKWINDQYPNPKGVVLAESKDSGYISGRARFRILAKDSKGGEAIGGFVSYDFKLTFRDGRYKYEIFGIRWEKASYYDVSEWYDTEHTHYDALNYPYFIEQTSAYFDKLLSALQEKLEEKEEVKKDDW